MVAFQRSKWSSPVFHGPCPDGRQRDVFPLPTLARPALCGKIVCRTVYRCLLRRGHVVDRVNNAIRALNSLFSGRDFLADVGVVSDLSEYSQFQKLAVLDIIAAVKKLGALPNACGSEALQTLRVASSGYGDSDPGVGEVVPLSCDDLSLPPSGVAGVCLLDALEPPLREVVDNFKDTMLQDDDVWTSISSNTGHLHPYSDPSLNDKNKFLSFAKLLYDRGILGFTSQVRSCVGAFAVSKKSKIIDGKVKQRQRLVLDCRMTNQMFRPSPYTQLGSLSSLTELQLQPEQQLFVSGADIQDCFYAVHIPECLQEYFCLECPLTAEEVRHISGGSVDAGFGGLVNACFTVLPMGFSWSFFLVQHIHQSAVCRSLGIHEDELVRDGFPAPLLDEEKVLSMPYCDNIHSISLQERSCNEGKSKIVDELSHMGFIIHEDEEASLLFNTLGGVIDGDKGEVRMTEQRAWNLIQAFEHVAEHPTSPDTIQRLLGHAMFFSTLNRNGMSVFRSLYDFVDKGGSTRYLTRRESRECRIFAGLVPLLFASIRNSWSETVYCSDASPDGHGLCARDMPEHEVAAIGRWNERWRYRRLEPHDWAPRQRALGRDPLVDVSTVLGLRGEWDDCHDVAVNDDFPEVPKHVCNKDHWRTVLMGKWDNTSEHITLKEGRALVLCLKRLCRCSSNRHKRHLVLVDNLALAMAANKGRAKIFSMLRITQQLSALALVGSFSCRVRWVPSEYNPSDGPSRGQVDPGPFLGLPFGQQEGEEPEADLSADSGDWASQDWNTILAGSSPAAFSANEVPEGCEEPGFKQERGDPSEESSDASAGGPGAPSGQKGSSKHAHSFGDEVSFSGSSESIQDVLGQVREFLPGQRVSLAPRCGRMRCVDGRLPGPDVRGRQVSLGRRKDRGGSRVHEHWAERKVGQKQTCAQGLAQGASSMLSSPIAKALGSRNGHEACRIREEADGTQADDRSRLLPASWRIHRHRQEGRGEAREERRASVPMVLSGHSGPRRWPGRQGGDLRQHDPLQQSGSPISGRIVESPSRLPELEPGQGLPLHCRRVPQKVRRVWGTVGSHRAPSISVSPRWGLRRSELKRKRAIGRQGPWKMGNRSKCPEVRQSGQVTETSEPVITKQSGILSVVTQKHGSRTPGHDECPQSLAGFGWSDVFAMPPPRFFCLEIFAGTARITSKLIDQGVAAFPIDICLFPSHNVLDIHVEHQILHWMNAGRIGFIWLGMPCTSFSRAGKWDNLGPGPLRDIDNLWGFPWLSSLDRHKVVQGNNLLRFTLRIIACCEHLHIPYALENPLSSYAWSMPPMQKFVRKFSPLEAVLDFCQYGEAWQKPTGILGNFWPVSELHRRCNSQGGVCSRTLLPHVRLTGTDAHGMFLTLKAQPYPEQLASLVAQKVASTLPRSLRST